MSLGGLSTLFELLMAIDMLARWRFWAPAWAGVGIAFGGRGFFGRNEYTFASGFLLALGGVIGGVIWQASHDKRLKSSTRKSKPSKHRKQK